MGRGTGNSTGLKQRPRSARRLQLKPVAKLSAKEIKRCSEMTLKDGHIFSDLEGTIDATKDEKLFGKQHSFVVFAYDGSKIIGWALMDVSTTDKGKPWNGNLQLLIDPEYRQRGYGRALVTRALKEKDKRFKFKPNVTVHDKASQEFFKSIPGLKLEGLKEFDQKLGKFVEKVFD